jgi:hypothetical protein
MTNAPDIRRINRGGDGAKQLSSSLQMSSNRSQLPDRRQFLGLAMAAAASLGAPARAAQPGFRFGLTPEFLDSDILLLQSL